MVLISVSILNQVGSTVVRCNVRVRSSVDSAIVSDCQDAGRTGHECECMLIDVHGTCASAAGITAGGIVPHSTRARCKPHVERVEEDAVGIIRVHGDSLVVPVLRIIGGAAGDSAVSERAALRALHISPGRAAVCRSPRTKLAAIGVAAAAIVIPNDGLHLRVDVIGVTRRDCDVDASELIGAAITGSRSTSNRIIARRAATGIHRRTRRVRAAGDLVTEHKPISIAGRLR